MIRPSPIAALALALALAGVGLPAAVAAQTTVTVELPFRTKYNFAGIQFATGAVQQAHVSVNSGGITAHAFGVYDFDASTISEADIYGDYYIRVSDMVGAYVGGAYYLFQTEGDWTGTPEAYGGVVLYAALTPTVHIAHDFDLGDGTRFSLGLSHSVPLGSGGVSLDFNGTLDYNAEYYTDQSGFSFADVSAGVAIPLGPLTVTPMAQYQRRLDDAFQDFIVSGGLFGLTASMTFGG